MHINLLFESASELASELATVSDHLFQVRRILAFFGLRQCQHFGRRFTKDCVIVLLWIPVEQAFHVLYNSR